jgi:hypothetical protein
MNNLFRLLRILTCAFLILGFQRPVFAQSEVRLAYIERFKDIAIFEMQTHKIPASIKLAQGILESGDGSSRLARDANNHFGIKCHTDWTGKRVYHDDDEKGECFRKYKDPAESYRDHSLFLVERSRYRALFELEITDYKAWAKGLRAAGYATNPKYSDLLIRIIEDYQLYQYDNVFFHRERMSGIFRHPNRVKFTAVEQSETIEQVAVRTGVSVKRLLRFNDMTYEAVVQPGDILFLQPKRNRGKAKQHRVLRNETMHDIAQEHAIKLHKLYYRNRMVVGVQPSTGDVLNLRRRVRK